MNFKLELVEKILAGEKTQTRRVTSPNPRSPWYDGACKLKLNRAYALCPGRGKHQVGKIRVLDLRRQLVGAINERDAHAEGFASRREFIEYWEGLHGSFDPSTPVHVVSFVLIQPEDYGLWEGGR